MGTWGTDSSTDGQTDRRTDRDTHVSTYDNLVNSFWLQHHVKIIGLLPFSAVLMIVSSASTQTEKWLRNPP